MNYRESPEFVSDTGNVVVDYIRNYKASNPTGWRKWIVGGFVAVLTLCVIAFFAFRAASHGRTLAALKSERDRYINAKTSEELQVKLSNNDDEREMHLERLAAVQAQLDRVKSEIASANSEHEANTALIDSISSWEDVDKKVQ